MNQILAGFPLAIILPKLCSLEEPGCNMGILYIHLNFQTCVVCIPCLTPFHSWVGQKIIDFGKLQAWEN